MKEYCPYYHASEAQGGLDYPWLTSFYGKLVKAEFNENNQGWIDYSQLHRTPPNGATHNWWIEHCHAVSHDVDDLYNSHMAIFVNPDTRSIVMRFTFESGLIYRSDIDTSVFSHFFALEAAYARSLVNK
jgi:hypothetical protein